MLCRVCFLFDWNVVLSEVARFLGLDEECVLLAFASHVRNAPERTVIDKHRTVSNLHKSFLRALQRLFLIRLLRGVGVWPVLSTLMLAYHGKESDDVRAALAYREYFGTDIMPRYDLFSVCPSSVCLCVCVLLRLTRTYICRIV